MRTSEMLTNFAIIAGVALLGLIIIGYGQLMLVIREIALNTRKEEKGKKYKSLETIALFNNFVGWAIIILGVLGGLIAIF